MTVTPAAGRLAARSDDAARAALRVLGWLAFATLGAFHTWLLSLHLLDGRAFEPATAARWLLAVLVLAGFRALSRRGLPLFSGRRAIVLWLLVVIIHCGAAWDNGGAALESAIPESVTALAQLSVATVTIGAALAAVLAAALGPRCAGCTAWPGPALIAGLPSTGVVFRFSPRPPPRV